MLPASAARKAADATQLIQKAAANGGKSTPAPASADVAELQRQLADLQGQFTKATEAYKALEGKYNAEVPRNARALAQAQAELKKAEEKVKELNAQLQKKAESFEVQSLDAGERELLGDKVIRATAKIAREAVDTALQSHKGIQDLTERVDMFERMNDEGYIITLDELVPDWERVNEDAQFVAWCGEVDPNTKKTRLDALKRAEAFRQGRRVAEIFLAFKEKREIGAAKAAPPKPQDETLHRRAEPAPGNTDESGEEILFDDQNRRIWKRSQIKKFYDDKRAHVYDGPEGRQKAAEIEADIFAAQREGRVRSG